MLKLLRRLICISTIVIVVFVAISLWSGGERFRWFGRKVEQQSERVGEKADMLKVRGERVLKGIENLRDRFRGKQEKKMGGKDGEPR
ncbi:MAG: hypothetical protein OHK0032_01370 [Thermodesulfovibrionales bacterium]